MKRLSIIGIAIILTFSGCGRKKTNLFSFPPIPTTSPTKKIEKFSLPIVTNVTIEKNTLSWHILEHSELIGYNIYQFLPNGVVRQKPLNKKPITDTSIPIIPEKYCYLIRAVFEINNQVVEGPASKILCNA